MLTHRAAKAIQYAPDDQHIHLELVNLWQQLQEGKISHAHYEYLVEQLTNESEPT